MDTKNRVAYEQKILDQYRQELQARNRELGIIESVEYAKQYGDMFILEGQDVTQSIYHKAAIDYLKARLAWLFHDQNVGIAEDNLFFVTGIEESKVGADLAVVDGLVVSTSNRAKSYEVGVDGPAPRLVFEFASESTWKFDLTSKLYSYSLIGANEYFACDISLQQEWKGEWLKYGRLIGWELNPATRQYQELPKDQAGRLWSDQLQRWLKVELEPQTVLNEEGYVLNLYDEQGRKQMSRAQAEHELRLKFQSRFETQEALTAMERQRAEAAEAAIKAERQRAEAAEAAIKAERQRADETLKAERQRIADLEALLHQIQGQSEP